ncbi:20S proteasome subunit alpha 6 [Pancytospora epiphaga]|nr:20S proteasome subunit alpha 6 [Pancytospora epiphaga]
MSGGFDYSSHLMFSPEGKLHQLDYIRRATELGNTCLALCNSSSGVLIAHIPKRSRLAMPQNKVFPINDTTLFAFSGITNDGLMIVKYLKDASTYEEIIKDRSIHYLEVFEDLCFDAARRSLVESARLYGVSGILMTDANGIKIVEFDPTGIAREAIGVSIGHRAQSCNTILEDCCDQLSNASLEDLVRIGIKALANAHPDPEEESLKTEDVYIYVMEIGKGYRRIETSEYMC